MLIYEKNGAGTVRQKSENRYGINVGTAQARIVEYNREDIIPVVAKAVKKRNLRKTMRRSGIKRKKHGSFLKAVTVAAAALFCIFTFDAKKLDGVIYEKTFTAVKGIVNSIFEQEHKPQPETNDVTDSFIAQEAEYTANMEKPVNSQHTDSENTVLLPQSDKDSTAEEPTASVSGTENMPVSVDGEVYYPIVTKDLSAKSVAVLSNATSYSPDMEQAVKEKPPALENLVINPDEPLVLIVHTHACESYTEYSGLYPKNEATRTEDTEKNVVRIGKEIADTLWSYGINTIHCTKLCDKESFINAYNVSHNTVKEYLEKYPSIRIVIDVHRDAIVKDSGESIRPAVSIAGQEYAQLMFVVGTDKSGHSHPDWQDNLSLAATVQTAAEERYPSLFRNINLRSVPFNQWLSDGYLLLEAGSVSNTLDEALLSAQAFAHTLTAVIKDNAV